MAKSTASKGPAVGISLREASRRLGVHLRAVQKRIQAGTLSTLPDGKLDWPTVEKEWFQNRDEAKVRNFVAGHDFLAAKTRREYIRLEREALELKRLRCELSPIGEVNAFVAGMIIRAREILTRIGPELKDRLAQESNPAEIERMIAGEVKQALEQLSEFKSK